MLLGVIGASLALLAGSATLLFRWPWWVGVSLFATAMLAVSWYAYFSLRRKLAYIPGPKPHPFFGNFPELRSIGQFRFYQDLAHKYGRICKYYRGRDPVVMISDPELVKEVAFRHFSIFHDRPSFGFTPRSYMRKEPPAGLLIATGNKWKQIRNALVPVFSSNQLRNFTPHIHDAIDRLLANLGKWSEQNGHRLSSSKGVDEPCIEISEWWSGMTMEVISTTSFGQLFPAQDHERGENHPVLQAAATMFRTARGSNNVASMIILSFPFLTPLVPWLARKQFTATINAIRTLDSTTATSLAKRKQMPNFEEVKDFLTLLLQARIKDEDRPLNNVEITDNAATFLLAGYETTASTLTFTTFLLSTHPEIMAKVHEEIDRLHPENGHDITYESLKEYEYLEACINESLRIYPPALLVRKALSDVEIGGIHIPKGTTVECPAFVLHHDEKNFPEPEVFRPERHLAPQSASINQYAFIPFGAGPRMCIGSRFAMEEAKLALIRVLRHYTFRLHPKTKLPLEVVHGITLAAKNGIHVVPVKRH